MIHPNRMLTSFRFEQGPRMSRSLWFAAGAGAGVYVMVRARRVAEAVSLDGLKDRASAAVVGLRALREEVATGAGEKETELRQRLNLVPHGRELAAPDRAPGLDPAAGRPRPRPMDEKGHS